MSRSILASGRMPVINWQKETRRIILPILLLPPFPEIGLDGLEAVALVDTGSTVSGVSVALAQALRLRKLGKRPLTSAQGEKQTERYAFRVGVFPDGVAGPTFPYVFEEVIGIELSNALTFTALIGMDILGQCDLFLARDRSARLVLP